MRLKADDSLYCTKPKTKTEKKELKTKMDLLRSSVARNREVSTEGGKESLERGTYL